MVASFISPYLEQRKKLRKGINNFIEVYLNCPLDECERRDVKGLYKKARAGELRQFTGVGPAASEVQTMSFSAANVVHLKTKSERKIELFNLNFSSGYNFLAPARELDFLRTSLRSKAIPNLDLQFISTHDFYDPSGTDLNLLGPRLRDFAVTTNFSWQKKTKKTNEPLPADTEYTKPREGLKFSVSHRYSENKTLGAFSKVHWLNFSTEFWATKNWKIGYQARYDVATEQMAEQAVEIYRDLHCWEGRISWIPSGFREGFYFRINIKALPEIKFEKGGSGLGTPFY